ncbi:MAG TPA: carboxypeptidase regulatory-like domain-containing protein [Myxococcaceae bacterium]|nr:carboxypeptidase regulatory-like domain-containing protein [Myxococcaceae bacterium]
MAGPDPTSSGRGARRWAAAGAVVALGLLLLLILQLRSQPGASPDASVDAPRRPLAAGRTAEALPAAPLPPEPERPLEPAVLGRVVSSWTGTPVAGAELTFAAPQGALTSRAGPDGAFRFVPPGPGSYQLAAVLAEGYVPFGPDWGQSPIRFVSPLPPGSPDLVVSLEPETRFRGKVEREDGGPLPEATVTLRVAGGGGPALASAERRWTTDAQGEFRGTAPEDGVLVARREGFLPGMASVKRARTALQLVRLVLKAAPEGAAAEQRLAGQVVDGAGVPVPAATVTLGAGRGRGPLGWALLPGAVSTDADGRFAFTGVPETTSWAQARTADGLSDPTGVHPGQTDAVLVVKPGGILAGRVLYSDGRPAPSFALKVSRQRRWPETPPVTLSIVDPEGRWELRGQRSGGYLLEAAAPGAAASGPVRIELPSGGGRVEKDIRLRRGHRLLGVVRDARTRAPVERAEVSLEASPAEEAVLARSDVFTGEDGRFELDGLPETPATLTVDAEGYNRKLVTLAAGRDDVEILLRAVPSGQEPATDLVGIGAVVNRGDQGIVLGAVVPSGGAALAGLAEGDTILRIDGSAVTDLGFAEAVQLLRGEEGSVVRLEVRRSDGSTTTVAVTRRAVSF